MSSDTAPAAAGSSVRFRLRSDVRVAAGEDGGFVLEDPSKGRFFRLGSAEYAVVSQLDGQTDLREAFIRAASCRAGQQPTAERYVKLQAWIVASGLVEIAGEIRSPQGSSSSQNSPAPTFNPCYFKFSLGDPARLLTVLDRALGWLFSLPALAVVVLLSLGAAVFVLQQWEKMTQSLSGILCPDQHLALFGCWLLLKIAHEIGHGVACRRLGGEVREWGLAFIYLAPVPYTDVTSSWRFGSRYDRMAVAAAGMYVEWILALVALLVWSGSASAAVQQLCVYTISLATVSTVVFNANPLCRLDGYYILSDLLGWPNFSSQAQRVTGNWFGRLLGGSSNGESANENALTGQRYWLLLSYGIASAAWRQLALITMAVVVLLAYEGIGALLIAGVLISWYAPRTSATANSIRDRVRELFRQPRQLMRIGAIVTIVALLAYFLPWPFPLKAPGIVENVEQHVVRAKVPGHVVALHANDGQWIEAGQPIVELRNDDLAFELAQLELTLAHGEAKLRSLHSKRQLVDYQVQQQRQETLQLQLRELRLKLDSLTIKAPAAGRIVARRLADLPGSYLAQGAEVCTVAEDGLKFRFSVAEDELPYFVEQCGQLVRVHFAGRTASGLLSDLEPQASTNLFDPALGAAAGGPLAVVARPAASQDPHSDNQEWILTRPRVTGTITFAAQELAGLTAGQRGSATLHLGRRNFATVVVSEGRQWFAGLQRRVQSSGQK